jgi:Zn-dependent protease
VPNRSILVFRPFGFAVRLDPSWFLIATLVTWSLARGLFPSKVPGLAPPMYWMMGVLGALGLFLSIVFHELCHALAGRRFGIRLRGIRLFIFGGVAEIADEPPSPRAEFVVAVVGPLSSLVLGGCAFLLGSGLQAYLPAWVAGVLLYLAGINVLLALFNLVPAFPLDGGRLLRAALWHRKQDIRWATRVTSRIGQGFGLVLVAVGLISVVKGNWIGGVWWVLIGFFLRGAAERAYRQVVFRGTLIGEPVRNAMTPEPISVDPEASIRDLIEGIVSRTHHQLYPVVERGRLLGAVTQARTQEIPRENWDRVRVKDITQPCSDANTIPPDLDALAALRHMQAFGARQLMVAEGDRLVGIVTLRDLMGFLSTKFELGSATPRAPDGN